MATESRSRSWSLRRRLVLSITGIVAVALVLMGVLSILSLRATSTTIVDSQLTASMSAIDRTVAKYWNGAGLDKAMVDFVGYAPGSVIAVVDDGRVADSAQFVDSEASTLDADRAARVAAFAASGGTTEDVDLGGLGGYRLEAKTNASGQVLVVGLPLEATQSALLQQALTIGVVAVLVLLLTAAGIMVTVRFALRPLARLVSTATSVRSLRLGTGDTRIGVRVDAVDSNPQTEIGQLGDALNRLLEHVDDALSERMATDIRMRRFVTDASHELRTPLAAIQGYAELTRQDSDQLPAMTEYSLARIEAEARRMNSLVGDLLLLARLDEGQDLQESDVELTDLVYNAVNDARAAAPEHQWSALVPEAPVVVRGDWERLHQLTANLLSNAGLHTPVGSSITAEISVAPTVGGGTAAILTVHDDGPGISPELLPNLFERFVRGDSSRARGTGGSGSTGLGLAIAQSIVEAHGGTIAVKSSTDGTTFTVTLPAPAAAKESAITPTEMVAADGK